MPEGDGGGLGRTGQVGAEYGGDPVVFAAPPQLPGLCLAPGGELSGQPARGASLLVVHSRGVRFKHHLYGHQPTLPINRAERPSTPLHSAGNAVAGGP